jgi:diguanylate cyclase (GGDEF)-like protein/PAS domain S-box-containing protein
MTTTSTPPHAGDAGDVRRTAEHLDTGAFFDLSLDLLCVVGTDGHFKLLNPAWERVLGIPRDVLCAAPYMELVHPDDRLRTAAEARKVGAGGTTVDFESRFRCGDGSYRWLAWTATSDPSGDLIYAVARDISATRLATEALRASEQRFRTLIDVAPEGILIVDGAGAIVLANRLVSDMFGYGEDELVGRPVGMLVPDALRDTHARHVAAFVRAPSPRGMGRTRTLVARRRDGSEFPAAIGLAPLTTDDGIHIVAIVTDVSEQHRVQETLRRTNAELESKVTDLQQLGWEASQIGEMSEMLQVAQSRTEADAVIERYARGMFSSTQGAVSLVNASRNLAERIVSWGDELTGASTFDPAECWALRRGKPHRVDTGDAPVACGHVRVGGDASVLCVPILAQGESLGVVTVVDRGPGTPHHVGRLATTFADNLGLALANLNLRERLRIQSIRDPVTGLFNRRYLEESLERELARAERRSTPIGVIMLDLDHFKAFNDTHGHRAGDAALAAIGGLIPTLVRGEDIPCRYGGEEFAVIMPDAGLEVAARRAEQIRAALAAVQVTHADTVLGTVTLSAGVAAYPEHGSGLDDLISAADRALYRAKAEGRDRVVVAGTP